MSFRHDTGGEGLLNSVFCTVFAVTTVKFGVAGVVVGFRSSSSLSQSSAVAFVSLTCELYARGRSTCLGVFRRFFFRLSVSGVGSSGVSFARF